VSEIKRFAQDHLAGARELVRRLRRDGMPRLPRPYLSAIPQVYKPQSAMGLPITTEGQKNAACAAHAASYYLATRHFRATGHYPRLGPRSLYAAAKSIDGLKQNPPGTDPLVAFDTNALGTTLLAIGAAITTFGVALDDLFPNDDLDDAIYGDFSLMSEAAIADARTRATGQRFFLAFDESPSIDSLKQLIYRYSGLLLVLKVGHEWTCDNNLKITGDPAVIMPRGTLRPPSLPTATAHHIIYAPAYDAKNLLFPNSWGPTWGNAGWGALGEDYMPHVVAGIFFV